MSEDKRARIEHAKGEVYRGNAWVRTEVDVRVELEVSDVERVIIVESFVTTEEAQAWCDGVLRGFDAAKPLWLRLAAEKKNGGAK